MIVAGLLAVAGMAFLSFSSAIPGNIDDLFIVLVYARHLLQGGGLYWNRLDGPVEGFTSPLDLLAKVGVTWIAPGDPVQAAFWCSLALHVATALALVFVVRAFGDSNRWRSYGVALLAGMAAASSHEVAFGASFLLESPLFILSVLAVLWVWFDRRPPLTLGRTLALATALTALALSRPEGVALMLVAMAFVVVREGDSAARKRVLIAFAGVLCLLTGLLVWRRLYFGAWAPNTYYAKTSSVRWYEIAEGRWYLKQGVLRVPGGLLLAVAVAGGGALLLPLWRDRVSRGRYALPALLALAATITVLLAGGDTYPGGRFLALPYTLAIVMLGAAALGLRGRLRAVPVAMLIVVLVSHALTFGLDRGLLRTQLTHWPVDEDDFACEAVAFRRLATIVGDQPVAQSDAQRLKYFEDDLRVIDLQGLSDRDIARQERWEPVRWGRYKPSVGVEVDAPVWIWGYRWLAREPMARVPMARLLTDPATFAAYVGNWPAVPSDVADRMLERYAPASIPACEGRYLNVLVRRDWIGAFRDAGVAVGAP